MDNDHTRQQMFNLLNVVHDNKYGHLYREVDRQQIKYVVYLRKSSEENSDKQLKSIGDQFQDIKDLILVPYKITDYDVVEEEHSAKTSDTRTEFRTMLDKIWAGEYQGLIAWHPVLFEGSLNVLSQSNSSEVMRRIESAQLAWQMVGFVGLDAYL